MPNFTRPLLLTLAIPGLYYQAYAENLSALIQEVAVFPDLSGALTKSPTDIAFSEAELQALAAKIFVDGVASMDMTALNGGQAYVAARFANEMGESAYIALNASIEPGVQIFSDGFSVDIPSQSVVLAFRHFQHDLEIKDIIGEFTLAGQASSVILPISALSQDFSPQGQTFRITQQSVSVVEAGIRMQGVNALVGTPGDDLFELIQLADMAISGGDGNDTISSAIGLHLSSSDTPIDLVGAEVSWVGGNDVYIPPLCVSTHFSGFELLSETLIESGLTVVDGNSIVRDAEANPNIRGRSEVLSTGCYSSAESENGAIDPWNGSAIYEAIVASEEEEPSDSYDWISPFPSPGQPAGTPTDDSLNSPGSSLAPSESEISPTDSTNNGVTNQTQGGGSSDNLLILGGLLLLCRKLMRYFRSRC